MATTIGGSFHIFSFYLLNTFFFFFIRFFPSLSLPFFFAALLIRIPPQDNLVPTLAAPFLLCYSIALSPIARKPSNITTSTTNATSPTNIFGIDNSTQVFLFKLFFSILFLIFLFEILCEILFEFFLLKFMFEPYTILKI